MITIFCLSNGDLGMELRDQPLSLDDRCYAFGIDPPNYPVPAIREFYRFELKQGCYRVGTDLFDLFVELVHYEEVAR